MLCVLSCKNATTANTTESKDYEAIVVALQNVQDSLQLNEATFKRVNDIIIRYENESREVQKQQFNNPKSKKQVMQNILKSRRTELSDVLKPKEVMSFNKLYKESLANEQKRKRAEKQLNKEDRQELTQKIQAYRTQSVAPILIEQRKALEAAMSATDKNQIAGLREKIMTFNKSLKDKKTACAAIAPKDRKAKMNCRRELRDLQKTYDPIKKEMEELTALLKEKPGTQTVMTKMENQRDVWRKGLKKILDKYAEQKVEVDKIPLHKYFRMALNSNFLLFDPTNLNQPVSAPDDEQNES